MPNRDPSSPARAASALRDIAHALNVSPDVFHRGSSPEEADDLLTLMRLWSQIDDGQARRRVLNLARQEAERSARPAYR